MMAAGSPGGTADPTPSQAPTLSAASDATKVSSQRRSEPLLAAGLEFGPYRIERLLGRGGMGEVYAAEERDTGRRLAIKILGERLTDAAVRARFLREGRLAAALSHPNTVYVFGTDEIDGRPVIAMELTEGGNLERMVKDEGPLDPTKAVDAILQVVAGLAAAAEAGVLHRDVKPSNCFVELDGAIKVGDFGLSISTTARDQSQLTTAGTFLGTPAFASPEQLRGDDLDVRSDIYSVGATLYFLLTGRAPFAGATVLQIASRALNERPDPLHEVRPGVPKELSALALRCLAKLPEERFADYAELRRSLEKFSSITPIPATPGDRFAAGFTDMLIAMTVAAASLVVIHGDATLKSLKNHAEGTGHSITGHVLGNAVGEAVLLSLLAIGGLILYFAVSEGRWGASVGKLAFGLRVTKTTGGQAGWARAFARAVLFCAAPTVAYAVEAAGAPRAIRIFLTWAGVALLFATARRSNGYAAVHDLMTGTRLVNVRARRQTAPLASPLESVDESTLSMLGPYHVLERAGGDLIEAYDARLQRRVWIWSTTYVREPISNARRDMRRRARPRWLAGKRGPDENWDAFERVAGAPFLELTRNPVPWKDAGYWLDDLADEIVRGLDDGTLPELALDRIWIGADGRARLLDWAVPLPATERRVGGQTKPLPAQESSAQPFLLAAAQAVLRGTGEPRSTGTWPLSLSLDARNFFDRLERGFYETPRAIAAELTEVLSSPGVISLARRLAQLGLCLMLLAMLVLLTVEIPARNLGTSTGWRTMGWLMAAGVGVAVGTFSRGGLSMWIAGIAVVDARGKRASLPSALVRTLLLWTPVLCLALTPTSTMTNIAVVAAGNIALAIGGVWSVLAPQRRLQDRLAGTYLVPVA